MEDQHVCSVQSKPSRFDVLKQLDKSLGLIADLAVDSGSDEDSSARKAAFTFIGRLVGQYLINNCVIEGMVYSLDETASYVMDDLCKPD